MRQTMKQFSYPLNLSRNTGWKKTEELIHQQLSLCLSVSLSLCANQENLAQFKCSFETCNGWTYRREELKVKEGYLNCRLFYQLLPRQKQVLGRGVM
jgi:hypothetical protein